MLYGDATARINQARRVFDSLTPGLLQLGSVWLPLPKLLLVPLVVNDWAWRTGALAGLPSMVAFVFGTLGIFRLLSQGMERSGYSADRVRLSAWTGVAVFVGNPNLLYLQSSAMSEMLSLALFVWAVVWLAEFDFRCRVGVPDRQAASRSLLLSAVCLAMGVLTRYDFWFFAPFFGLWALVVVLRTAGASRVSADASLKWFSALRPWLLALSIVTLAGALWLGLNWSVYGNALEFANGPYSAKAIQQRMLALGERRHAGDGQIWEATLVYVQAARANFADGPLGAAGWFFAVVGAMWAALQRRAYVAWLLWLPLVFYALSIAYGSVPVYVPGDGSGNLYNVRYGTALIPAASVSVGWWSAAIWRIWERPSMSRWLRGSLCVVMLLVVVMSYVGVARSGPVCFREAAEAWPSWRVMDERVGSAIAALPPHSRIMMAVALQGRAVQASGRNFREFVYEDSQPVGLHLAVHPVGLWDIALADPLDVRASVDYAIGFEGDLVDKSARVHGLPVVRTIESPGWPKATVYAARAGR